MKEFFTWTAWPMEKPPAYGAFHLGFVFVGLALIVLLCWLLRNTNEKQNRIVLLSCGVFLILTEIYKQLFYYYYIGNGSYQWWIFPFQLCSVPMYLCIIAPLLKPGKVQDAMYDFLLAFNLMSGFVAFTEPSGLVHEYVTLTWHAFIWHMMLVFIGAYLGASGRACRRLRDFGRAVIVYVGLCALAFVINIVFYPMGNHDINMFYVGPMNNSPLIVFKDISARFGWYVNTPLYIFCTCLAAFIVYSLFLLGKRVLNRRRMPESIETAKIA